VAPALCLLDITDSHHSQTWQQLNIGQSKSSTETDITVAYTVMRTIEGIT